MRKVTYMTCVQANRKAAALLDLLNHCVVLKVEKSSVGKELHRSGGENAVAARKKFRPTMRVLASATDLHSPHHRSSNGEQAQILHLARSERFCRKPLVMHPSNL